METNGKRGIPRKNLQRTDRKGESLASKGLIMMMSMITITMPTIMITMMMMIIMMILVVVVVVMMMMKMVTMMMIKMMLRRRMRMRRMIIMIMMVTVVVTKQNLFTNFAIEIKSDLHTEQETWRLFPACSLYGRYTLWEARSSKKSFNK